MRRFPWAAVLLLAACGGCGAVPGGRVDLGDAERSWARALRAGRQAGWPYDRIGTMRQEIERSREARALCDAMFDLADNRIPAPESLEILRAAAQAAEGGTPADPVAASVQLMARSRYPWEVQVQALAVLPKVKDPEALVKVLDRAVVFGTEAWTTLQFLKELRDAEALAPLSVQAALFDEALGRRGRPLEAQAVLACFRDGVREGLPAEDLAAAFRRRIRRGAAPDRLERLLKDALAWPGPPLERTRALRLVSAGLAHGLPDEEVAALGPFVARSSLDARDAEVLADRLEAGIRSGLEGRELLARVLEDFSGARPAAPAAR